VRAVVVLDVHEFAQRYRRTGLRRKFQTVGNVGYVGERPAIFT
jgi:hypothetical protein